MSELQAVEVPKLKRDWIGRFVRIKRRYVTWHGKVFEAGEVLRVDRNYTGLHVHRQHRCAVCQAATIDAALIPESYVELLPKEYQPQWSGVVVLDPYRRDMLSLVADGSPALVVFRAMLKEMLGEVGG